MTPYNSVILQNDINNLAPWANTSQTQFNVTKRHIMRISRKKESLMTDYYNDGQKLFTVKKNPSVGVMLSNDLRWNPHIENKVKQVIKSVGFVNRNLCPCSEIENPWLTPPLRDLIWSTPQQYGTLTCKIRLIQLRQSNNVQWDLLKIFAETLCRNATALRFRSFKGQAQSP